MITITVLLLAASIAWGLSRVLSVPAVATLLLAGLLLNVVGLREMLEIDNEIARDILLLGLTFLVFHAGTELSPGRIGRRGSTAVVIGSVQFATMTGLGTGIAWLVSRDVAQALHYGLAIGASSTLVIVRLLQRRRQFFEPWAQLVVGVLLVQDVLLLAAITLVEGSEGGTPGMQTAAGCLFIIAALAFVWVRWVTPWLILRRRQDDESLLLILLSTLFIFLGLSKALDVPLVVGAFAAGVSLSAFPVHALVRGQLYTLADFFIALFFVSLGFFVEFPPLSKFPLVLGLSAVVVLVTPPLVAAIAERAGLTARGALESGLLLAQASEFSIVVGLVGVFSGALTNEDLGVLTLITMITMIATPFVATGPVLELLLRLHPGTGVASQPDRSGHILMLGCGQLGFTLLETLRNSRHDVVVVDDDPAIVARIQAMGIEAIRGDAVDPQTLTQVSASKARAIISLIRRVEDNVAMLRRISGQPAWVRVFEDGDARTITAAGGHAVPYAEATAESFAHWYGTSFLARDSERDGDGDAAADERPAVADDTTQTAAHDQAGSRSDRESDTDMPGDTREPSGA